MSASSGFPTNVRILNSVVYQFGIDAEEWVIRCAQQHP